MVETKIQMMAVDERERDAILGEDLIRSCISVLGRLPSSGEIIHPDGTEPSHFLGEGILSHQKSLSIAA